MNSYNKSYLDSIAKENGFVRDNLEKVMRLTEILRYFNQSTLLKEALVLKGGTAINLTVFEMPRLSVDIDLDFAYNCSRDEMLSIREKVNAEIFAYMNNEGYALKPGSKNPHTLDSWVFGYTNAGGNGDNIKIEINYSDRCHVLQTLERHINIDFLGDASIHVLHPIELFASKINALVNRGAMRDLYDVYNMLQYRVFQKDEELEELRKIFVFYYSVGASSKADDVTLEFKSFPKIENVNYNQVRAQLLPVLRRSDNFNYLQAKEVVLGFLHDFLQFSEAEKDFVAYFNKREYHPEILFGEGEIACRVAHHPMALWKCRPKA